MPEIAVFALNLSDIIFLRTAPHRGLPPHVAYPGAAWGLPRDLGDLIGQGKDFTLYSSTKKSSFFNISRVYLSRVHFVHPRSTFLYMFLLYVWTHIPFVEAVVVYAVNHDRYSVTYYSRPSLKLFFWGIWAEIWKANSGLNRVCSNSVLLCAIMYIRKCVLVSVC